VHRLANSAPPLAFGHVDDRVARSRRCPCSLLARPRRFKPAPVALSFFPSSAPSPQQLNPISLACSFALPSHTFLTCSPRLSSSESVVRSISAAAVIHGRCTRLHRGWTSTEHLSSSCLFLQLPCDLVMLTGLSVLSATRRSAPCCHVRRCSSPAHVGSPPQAVSGQATATGGCARTPGCSLASSSPPAGTTVPGNRCLRRPLFFKSR
jgi:hypothetical protein